MELQASPIIKRLIVVSFFCLLGIWLAGLFSYLTQPLFAPIKPEVQAMIVPYLHFEQEAREVIFFKYSEIIGFVFGLASLRLVPLVIRTKPLVLGTIAGILLMNLSMGLFWQQKQSFIENPSMTALAAALACTACFLFAIFFALHRGRTV